MSTPTTVEEQPSSSTSRAEYTTSPPPSAARGGNYAHNYIEIEGVSFVNDEPTTPTASYIVWTKAVTVSDGKLTMVMGVTATDEYTMPNYLDIEAVAPPLPVRNLRILQVQ